jgi:cell division protein ZapA
MTQSVVTIRLNGNPYQIGCGAGEENHVSKLGAEVEAVMQSLVAASGQIGEARLLAMVALILADRAASTPASPVTSELAKDTTTISTDNDKAAEALEKASERIATLASRFTST